MDIVSLLENVITMASNVEDIANDRGEYNPLASDIREAIYRLSDAKNKAKEIDGDTDG